MIGGPEEPYYCILRVRSITSMEKKSIAAQVNTSRSCRVRVSMVFDWTRENPKPTLQFHIPYFRFIAAHPGAAAPTISTKRSMSFSGMRLMSILFQYRVMMKTISCASRSDPRLVMDDIKCIRCGA